MYQTSQNVVSIMPLLQTLLGGVLTFLGGILGSFLIQRSQRNAEKENLASAFYGEIGAVLSLIESRQYIQILAELAERIKAPEPEDKYNFFENRDDKFGFYENSVGKIGLLSAPIPEKLISFYALATAAYDDLKNLDNLKAKGYDALTEGRYVQELIALLNEVVKSGKAVQSLLKPDSHVEATPINSFNPTP